MPAKLHSAALWDGLREGHEHTYVQNTMPKTAPTMCPASAAVTFVRGVGWFCCAQSVIVTATVTQLMFLKCLLLGKFPSFHFIFALTPQPRFREERPEMSPCPMTAHPEATQADAVGQRSLQPLLPDTPPTYCCPEKSPVFTLHVLMFFSFKS